MGADPPMYVEGRHSASVINVQCTRIVGVVGFMVMGGTGPAVFGSRRFP